MGRFSISLMRSRSATPQSVSFAAAACVRYLQELRGLVARGLHGRQWCRHAREGDLMRAQGGGRRRWQEEVSWRTCFHGYLRIAGFPKLPVSRRKWKELL